CAVATTAPYGSTTAAPMGTSSCAGARRASASATCISAAGVVTTASVAELDVDDLAEGVAQPEDVGDPQHQRDGVGVVVLAVLHHVELAHPGVRQDGQVADRVDVVLVGQVRQPEQVSHVTGDRPLPGHRPVGQQHLHVLPAHPGDHEHLLAQADEPDCARITGQPTQLPDQLLEVVGKLP